MFEFHLCISNLLCLLDQVKAPESGNDITEPFPFNLMFSTQIGPTGKAKGFETLYDAYIMLILIVICDQRRRKACSTTSRACSTTTPASYRLLPLRLALPSAMRSLLVTACSASGMIISFPL